MYEINAQLGFAFDGSRLEVATEIAKNSGSENKWKQLGELAMSSGKLIVSEDCLRRAGIFVELECTLGLIKPGQKFGFEGQP